VRKIHRPVIESTTQRHSAFASPETPLRPSNATCGKSHPGFSQSVSALHIQFQLDVVLPRSRDLLVGKQVLAHHTARAFAASLRRPGRVFVQWTSSFNGRQCRQHVLFLRLPPLSTAFDVPVTPLVGLFA